MLAVCLTLATAGSVFAQTGHQIFDAHGLQPHRPSLSQLPFEHIDLATGSLTLTFEDLVLPGNAGRDLRFTRTYNAKGHVWTFGLAGIPLHLAPNAAPFDHLTISNRTSITTPSAVVTTLHFGYLTEPACLTAVNAACIACQVSPGDALSVGSPIPPMRR